MSSRSNICTWRVLYRRQPFGNPEHSGLFFPTKNIGKTRGLLSRTEGSLGTGHTLPHGAAGAQGQAPKRQAGDLCVALCCSLSKAFSSSQQPGLQCRRLLVWISQTQKLKMPTLMSPDL